KTPPLIAANPIVLLGYAVKLGKDYLLLVGFCVIVVVLSWLTGMFGNFGFTAPLLGTALTNFERLALAFVGFRGIGLLVRARGAELGYGGEDAYMVPALGDAQPRGKLAAPPPPPEKPAPAPIDLEPASPEDPSADMVKAIAQ